ncbi:hypothetical protein [uncultured Bartonella sp.]|uniref:hypothetical protein n=1 Tax=uncultured Bartonella sp. TaxID=104108 RepID=UPI002627C3AB|nr:hypothetical protein [uncultured Bartonella sp.]
MSNFVKTLILAFSFVLPLSTTVEAADHRFEFQKVEDGYLRFDSDTGSIDKCLEKRGEITCTISNDDRARLEQEIKTLKDKITQLEENKTTTKSTLPSKQDMDQAYDTMKYFFDKFKNDLKTDEAMPNNGADKL